MYAPSEGSPSSDAARALISAAIRLEGGYIIEVFLERGYVATTMPAIAERAGVALDTVYASVGRKPALFRELIETAISGRVEAISAERREYVKAMLAEPKAARKLEIYAAAVTEMQPRLAPLVALVREAAAAEEQLASLWKEIADRRAANMRLFAAELARSGRLRVGIEEAADVI